MPFCKDDPKKSYKGDEPSPKGLGYCAHIENIGSIKEGLDGNKWIVTITSKGIKRWIKHKETKIKIYNEKQFLKEKWWDDDSNRCDCSKFVSYKRSPGRKYGINYKYIHGLEYEKGKLYKFISYNNFSKKAINIDYEKWNKYEQEPNIIEKIFCGSKKKLTSDNPIYKKINHIGYNHYYTRDEYGKNFLAYVKGDTDPVYIYKIPGLYESTYFVENNYYKEKWAYIQLVAEIHPEKVFLGECPKESNKWKCEGRDGSSILLKLNNLEYIYIGSEIYTFTAISEITNFISLVSYKSDFTCPYAIDKDNNFYLMVYKYYANKNKKIFDNIYDPYKYYYESNKDFKKFKNLKYIFKVKY